MSRSVHRGTEGSVRGLSRRTNNLMHTGDGWYYDNPANPTQVNLCPQTCTTVQADFGAKVELRLGCLGS